MAPCGYYKSSKTWKIFALLLELEPSNLKFLTPDTLFAEKMSDFVQNFQKIKILYNTHGFMLDNEDLKY